MSVIAEPSEAELRESLTLALSRIAAQSKRIKELLLKVDELQEQLDSLTSEIKGDKAAGKRQAIAIDVTSLTNVELAILEAVLSRSKKGLAATAEFVLEYASITAGVKDVGRGCLTAYRMYTFITGVNKKLKTIGVSITMERGVGYRLSESSVKILTTQPGKKAANV